MKHVLAAFLFASTSLATYAEPREHVRDAYKLLSENKPTEAKDELQVALKEAESGADPLALSLVYTALADREKFLAAGSPMPFDGTAPGRFENNHFATVVTGPDTTESAPFTKKAEDVLAIAAAKAAQENKRLDQMAFLWELSNVFGRQIKNGKKEEFCNTLAAYIQTTGEEKKVHPNASFEMWGTRMTLGNLRELATLRMKKNECSSIPD